MKRISLIVMALFLAPALILLDAAARAQSPEEETDSLYLGNRAMLTVSAPRQLTLNAHIQDFVWSPDGRRIAYLSRTEDLRDSSVGIISADGKRQRLIFQCHALESNPPENPSSFVQALDGWSPEGTYLAFTINRDDPAMGHSAAALLVGNTSDGTSVAPPISSTLDGTHPILGIFNVLWSPGNDVVVYQAYDGVGGIGPILVYDVTTGESHEALPEIKRQTCYFWTDATHLLVSGIVNGVAQQMVLDILTGQTIPVPRAHLSLRRGPLMTARVNAGTAGVYALSLQKNPDSYQPDTWTFAPAIDAQGKPHRSSVHLWVSVRRDQPAFPASPHPAVAGGVKKKADPQLLIDSFRYEGPDDEAPIMGFAPGLQTSRAQVAYLISGDLYVSTISVRAPSIQELIAAGEKLTCPEERAYAAQNAKDLGLALMQYSQDYDNTLPPAENFHDALYPYVRAEDAFGVGDHRFRFLLDGDEMKSLDRPENVEMGDFDLPCGRIVLYADGHVQTLDKDGKSTPLP